MQELKTKIYKIKSGHHVVCYIDPVTQKRKRKKFLAKADAKNYEKNLDLKLKDKGPAVFNQTPLAHYIELHLERSPGTRMLERKVHFKSFCEEFGSRAVNQVNKTSLEAWFQKIKTNHDLSDRTMNTIKSNMNSFFHFLEEQEVITQSPLSKIKFERKPPPRRPRIVLSIEQVHKILDGAKAHSPCLLYPILFIAAYTGARRSEVLKLKRTDVDFDSGLIHFRLTKNGDDRSIRISKSLKEFLGDFLKTHESDFVVPYFDGSKVPDYIIGKHLRRFKKFFPIGKDWGLHSLRHSFAYNFLRMGGNMYQLQAVLGHKSIDVTVDVYGQIGAQDVENACPYEQEKRN